MSKVLWFVHCLHDPKPELVVDRLDYNLLNNLQFLSDETNFYYLKSLDLSYNRIDHIPRGFLSSKHTISHVNLSFNMITEISSTDFHNMLGLQDIAITLKHLRCPTISGIFNQIEEIRFSGCEINIKDYFGLDKLTYISILRSNVTSMDFLYRVNAPNLTYLQTDYNLSLLMFDIIKHSGLPHVLCESIEPVR
ncbi:hypothetical protein GJ496_004166 [Pomphorhynchus laevis]|nr:hypothetical protein GJ496_004166 [Pomphorhynchus laevis]